MSSGGETDHSDLEVENQIVPTCTSTLTITNPARTCPGEAFPLHLSALLLKRAKFLSLAQALPTHPCICLPRYGIPNMHGHPHLYKEDAVTEQHSYVDIQGGTIAALVDALEAGIDSAAHTDSCMRLLSVRQHYSILAPKPLDPCLLQLLIYEFDLASLHPALVSEWHPLLAALLREWSQTGPAGDLGPFCAHLALYLLVDDLLNQQLSSLAGHNKAAHLAYASEILWTTVALTRIDSKPETWLSHMWAGSLLDFDSAKPRLQVLGPAFPETSLQPFQAAMSDPLITLKSILVCYLKESGLPCPAKFAEVQRLFSAASAQAATGAPIVNLWHNIKRATELAAGCLLRPRLGIRKCVRPKIGKGVGIRIGELGSELSASTKFDLGIGGRTGQESGLAEEQKSGNDQ
ncbi:hypothetical protein BC835DRAFT_1530530 [Cytidiella melzeri]|nr:hypothetical protein BC835DRAFT_1530530 [Cytidiella melzeri]